MVAEHLERPEAVIAELTRVLEDSGLLLIHTPNAAGYGVRLAQLTWQLMPRRVVHSLIRFLEHREAEDVFPTFYRANTRKRLYELASCVGMEEQEFKFVEGRSCFYFLAPLSVLELVLCRLLRSLGRKDLSAGEILAVYRKKPIPALSDKHRDPRPAAVAQAGNVGRNVSNWRLPNDNCVPSS